MKKYLKYIKTSVIGKVTFVLLIFIMFLGMYCFSQISIYVPTDIFMISLIVFTIIIVLLVFSHYKIPKIAIVLEIIVCICLSICVLGVQKVNTFTDKVTEIEEFESVQIVTLKNSNITKEQSFSNLILAYSQDDNQSYIKSSEILKENKKSVKIEKPYENMKEAYNDLKNKKIDLLVLTNIGKSDLSIIDENYTDKIKIILSKNYRIESASTKNVDISQNPFTIYFQGTDLSSKNNINSTGRGDVNILLTVNPKTKKVNLQVIPRDLFVYIPCKNANSKLSYSGWWGGVQSSIASIEDKLDIEINYYAKINFDGLIDLVDALDGVKVYSHYTYDAEGYHFTKGYNEVDGEKALIFARARKMLPLNERSRGYQQMELIKGIFSKFSQEPTYTYALNIIDTLENNFTTNLPKKDFIKAYQLVVDLLPELQTMENHSIEGVYKWHYDEVRTNYYQYYFYPDSGELEDVKERIQYILNGK